MADYSDYYDDGPCGNCGGNQTTFRSYHSWWCKFAGSEMEAMHKSVMGVPGFVGLVTCKFCFCVVSSDVIAKREHLRKCVQQ